LMSAQVQKVLMDQILLPQEQEEPQELLAQ
jgi:hypothetical protein